MRRAGEKWVVVALLRVGSLGRVGGAEVSFAHAALDAIGCWVTCMSQTAGRSLLWRRLVSELHTLPKTFGFLRSLLLGPYTSHRKATGQLRVGRDQRRACSL